MSGKVHLTPANMSGASTDLPGSPKALAAAASAAMQKAKEAQGWYTGAIPTKRRGAIVTRLGAIVLGSVATVVPTVLGIVASGTPGHPEILQRWVPIGGVLAVIAALLVLVDKFAGYSSGWMRYIGADQELRARQEQFELLWSKERAQWPDKVDVLPPALVAAALDMIGVFVTAINDVVRQETQAWMAEFKGALAEIDQSTQQARTQAMAATAPKVDRGAIEVVVAGLAKLDKQTWSLQVGDGAAVTHVGAESAALVGLPPGALKVRVEGLIDSKPWVVEKAAQVEAGKTTPVPVNIPP